jgi:hypothetical protein
MPKDTRKQSKVSDDTASIAMLIIRQIELEVAERTTSEKKGAHQARLLASQRNALVGYAKIDLFGDVKLEFGLVNNRPVSDFDVKTLVRNIVQNGIL